MSAVTGLIIACLAFSLYVSPSLQILGGDDALYPHPYQAALFVQKSGTILLDYFCGGAIITKRYVITAANCFALLDNWQYQFIHVGVGSVLLNETTKYRVDALIPHAGYDAEGNYYGINDIALVRVLRDIVFNENVQPIKLPDSDRNYDNYPFIVTGWGKDEEGPWHPNTLQELVVKGCNEFCLEPVRYKKKFLLLFNSKPKDEKMCDLDNGNPVVTDGVLIGVVAESFLNCVSMKSSLYTSSSKVFYYKSWIEFHVGSI